MDKRGVDLTLNTIVIAVLVVIALIVLVVFFLGGFERLTEKIKGTEIITTAGTDLTLAVQACEQYCDQAKLLPTNLLKASQFCTKKFKIEDQKEDYVCDITNHVSVGEGENLQGLGVTCEVKCK